MQSVGLAAQNRPIAAPGFEQEKDTFALWAFAAVGATNVEIIGKATRELSPTLRIISRRFSPVNGEL